MIMDLKPIKRNVITEKNIEQYLVKQINLLGGRTYKFVSPGKRAIADRICIIPYGIIVFVECKRPGKEPTLTQFKELDFLINLGAWATWVGNKNMIHNLIDQIKKSPNYAKTT